jgi:hypothetical protein
VITRSDVFLAHARARAEAAHAAAEAADSPNARAAWKAAAATWERIAGPGTPWSTKLLRQDLACFKRHVAYVNGPFKAPEPPKAPPPVADQPERETVTKVTHAAPEVCTIDF